MAKIKVLQVDQLTGSGKNITGLTLADFEDPETINKVHGGDADTARMLGIASARIREVEENSTPPWGYVWYREGTDGKLVFFKATYDSSG